MINLQVFTTNVSNQFIGAHKENFREGQNKKILKCKDNNNIMVIFIELQFFNIFCPRRGKCPILPLPMDAYESI